MIKQNLSDEESSSLDEKGLSSLQEKMASFSRSYRSENFQNVYNFKSEMESMIMELTTEEVLKNADDASNISSILNLCTAPKEGILVLSKDGYEGKTPETVTVEDFDQKNYTKESFRMNSMVKSGDPIYKLLTDETWEMVIQLDKKTATQLADNSASKIPLSERRNCFLCRFFDLTVGGDIFWRVKVRSFSDPVCIRQVY